MTRSPTGADATEPPVRVAGIVPQTTGWVGVELRDRRFRRAFHEDTLVRVIMRLGSVEVITLAAPLGLPSHQIRAADTATAHLLGRRATAPLPAPPACALTATTQPAGAKISRHTTGITMNTKAWALRHHIREAHELWLRHPRLLHEAHPDLAYAQLTGTVLATSPSTWSAHNAVLRLLDGQGIVVPDDIGAAGTATTAGIFGAAVIAWTAHRIATANALSHPDPPEHIHGAPVAIWT